MSSNVIMIHGYGFCFQENAVGIIPSKLYSFLEQHPEIREKVMDKDPDFFETICKNRENEETISYEEYEMNDYDSCCGLAALFTDIVNELKEIGLEVQWDDENGNVIMLPTAAPWEYSKKQKEITSSDHLSQILAECSMESGIVVNTDVNFVTAECWG